MPENEREIRETTRREFIKDVGLFVFGAAIGSAALTVGCGYPTAPQIDADACSITQDTVRVTLDKIPELSYVGGSAAIANDNEHIHIIIVRTGEDEYVVASNQCTHQGKKLGYDRETEMFICASGKSKFRLDGSVVRGPAERALRIYNWHRDKGILIIDIVG